MFIGIYGYTILHVTCFFHPMCLLAETILGNKKLNVYDTLQTHKGGCPFKWKK